MLWYSMITPPERDGTYYVRDITTFVDSDLRERGSKPYWRIRSLPFTVAGGWNTHIDSDGIVFNKHRMTFEETAEWSEVEYVDD